MTETASPIGTGLVMKSSSDARGTTVNSVENKQDLCITDESKQGRNVKTDGSNAVHVLLLILKQITMKTSYRKAFDKLKAKGISVRESETEDYGVFWIDCETGSVQTELALDYYDNPEGSDFLNKTLEGAGLYFEWYNAAYATVHEDW